MVPSTWIFISGLLLVTVAVDGMPPGRRGQCIDQHVWLFDGSVECKFLEIESYYGLHNDPQRWCAYSLTDCCETCERIKRRYERPEVQNVMGYPSGQTVVQVQLETQQVNNDPQQMNNEPQQMNNEPQQMNNEPQQMNNEPQQMNNDPQHMNNDVIKRQWQ